MIENCANCLLWNRYKETDDGVCDEFCDRTDANDWCPDWEAKEG